MRARELAASSFTLAPHRALDLAFMLGLHVRWLMEHTNGGASGRSLLQRACRAIESGDASATLISAGDHLPRARFRTVAEHQPVSSRPGFPSERSSNPAQGRSRQPGPLLN